MTAENPKKGSVSGTGSLLAGNAVVRGQGQRGSSGEGALEAGMTKAPVPSKVPKAKFLAFCRQEIKKDPRIGVMELERRLIRHFQVEVKRESFAQRIRRYRKEKLL